MSCQRSYFLRRDGVTVYRVPNHGHPEEGYMIFWYRTVEARLLESHPTDFDVRALPSDLVEKFHLERMRTPRSVHRLAIIEAIDRKIVTREGGPRKAYVSDVPALSSASDDEDLFW